MKFKIIIAAIVVAAALIFGAMSFLETNVEYTDFHSAMDSHKKCRSRANGCGTRNLRSTLQRPSFPFL